MSGALAAGRKSLDLLGVFVIAAITAIGGGTIRDLLLDRHPIAWIQRPMYLLVIVLAVAATLVWTRRRPAPLDALLIADALGLALFAISGARIAEQLGLPWPSVILMGTITGAAGGVVRDLLTAEIPLVLRRDIYVTAAIVGIATYLLLSAIGAPTPVPSVVGAAVIVGLRLAAILYDLHLPAFSYRDRE